MTKLLIVVDMQNDFVTGVLGSEDARGVVPAVVEKVTRYRQQGAPVIFTMDTHQQSDYAESDPSCEAARIPQHCLEGTEGWELVPELRPLADSRSKKPSFLSTSLAEEVRADFGGEDLSFELCGVCTDICVVSNALMLRGEFPKSPIAVDASCCAGSSEEAHRAALTVMRSCLIDIVE